MEAAGFLGAGLAMNTLAPVMTKITQNESGGYSYNKWCVYFFAELIKLGVAATWSMHLKATDPSAAAKMRLETKENLRYAGPVREPPRARLHEADPPHARRPSSSSARTT